MDSELLPDNNNEILYVKRGEGKEIKLCGFLTIYFKDLSKVEEEFICKRCGGIIRAPNLSNGEITCLVCSETPEQSNPVNLVEACINKLEIKCPLLRDCGWKGKLSEVEDHLNNCQSFLVKCSVCQQFIVTRGAMEEHQHKGCPMRDVECEYCEQVFYEKDLEGHKETCLLAPIKCPNGCIEKFPRGELASHNAVCPLAEVECPYAKYGCEVRPFRKYLASHSKLYLAEHTQMNLRQLENQEEKLENQEEKLGNHGEKLGNQEEKLKNQEEKLKNQEEKLRNQGEELKNQGEKLGNQGEKLEKNQGDKIKEIKKTTETEVNKLRIKLDDVNCLEEVEWTLRDYRELRQTSPTFFVKNVKL